MDETFACLAEKRLDKAEANGSIQGYKDGVFWERNSGVDKPASANGVTTQAKLFPLDKDV
jgi:site-specific DNA-methyltransferase (adenine-specific)